MHQSELAMANPSRPVTGYPAPNQHPANGYSANIPPTNTGAAYPYTATTPASGYYGYQNYPQNYQYGTNYDRHAVCLRRIFAIVIGLVIIFGTITFIVWLVLRPQLPEYRVDSFSVANFTLGNDSLVSFTAAVRLTATNPNKKMSLQYDEIGAVIFYRSYMLSQTSVPPFSQETRNVTSLTANFAAAGSFVDQSVVNGINAERGKNGNVNFNFRMVSRVLFAAKAWRTRRRIVKVFCGDLIVGIPSNGSSGVLTAATKPCRVGI